MAFPTAVNNQITDAVTQANVTILGSAPAVALSNTYQAAAHATGLMMQNAVANQQQVNLLAEAVTANLVAMLNNSGK